MRTQSSAACPGRGLARRSGQEPSRGSALLTVIVSLMVLFLISGIFYSVVLYNLKSASSEEKILKAYYMAESGINYEVGLALKAMDVRPRPNADGLNAILQSSLNQTKTPFASDAGYGTQAAFTVKKITIDPQVKSIIVTTEGTYANVKRTVTEQYAFSPIPPGP